MHLGCWFHLTSYNKMLIQCFTKNRMCLFILTTMASAKYWAELSSKSLPEIMIKLIDILIKLIDTVIKLRNNKLDEGSNQTLAFLVAHVQ